MDRILDQVADYHQQLVAVTARRAVLWTGQQSQLVSRCLGLSFLRCHSHLEQGREVDLGKLDVDSGSVHAGRLQHHAHHPVQLP